MRARLSDFDYVATVVEDPEEPYLRGARLFDAGAFFDAHEAWEQRWRVTTRPAERVFLQGLIQVAAAFHKLVVVGSRDSASRLLGRGLAKLEACPAEVAARGLGAFLAALRAAAQVPGVDGSSLPKMVR